MWRQSQARELKAQAGRGGVCVVDSRSLPAAHAHPGAKKDPDGRAPLKAHLRSMATVATGWPVCISVSSGLSTLATAAAIAPR